MGRRVNDQNQTGVKLKGMFRVNIVDPDGTIQGDSGWVENSVTNSGMELYLARVLAGVAGSMQVAYMALGTGTQPAAADTALQGEVMGGTARHSITSKAYSSRSATNGTATQYFYGTFTSGFLTANQNISNIGLFASSSVGTVFAGNTYASSVCAVNQAVNATYQIQFS